MATTSKGVNVELPTINNHTTLKELAKQILRDRGVKEENIFTEYKMSKLQTGFRVDVLGKIYSRGSEEAYTVAFEVGNCPAERIMQLKVVCNEVYWLPFNVIPALYSIQRHVIDALIISQEKYHEEIFKKYIKDLKTVDNLRDRVQILEQAFFNLKKVFGKIEIQL